MPNYWDEEPEDAFGLAGEDKARRWRRSWNQYLVVFLLVAGVMMVIGSVSGPGLPTLGGALVITAAAALTTSDGPRHKPGRPRPPQPTLRHEVLWTTAAVVLAAAGIALFAV